MGDIVREVVKGVCVCGVYVCGGGVVKGVRKWHISERGSGRRSERDSERDKGVSERSERGSERSGGGLRTGQSPACAVLQNYQ